MGSSAWATVQFLGVLAVQPKVKSILGMVGLPPFLWPWPPPFAPPEPPVFWCSAVLWYLALSCALACSLDQA